MTLNLTFMTTASNCRNQIRNRVTIRSAKVKREFRLYSHFATITNRGQNKKILFNRYHTRTSFWPGFHQHVRFSPAELYCYL